MKYVVSCTIKNWARPLGLVKVRGTKTKKTNKQTKTALTLMIFAFVISVLIAIDNDECVDFSLLYPGGTHDRTIYRESRVPELLSQAKVYAIADEIYGDDLPFIVSARNTAELPASSVFTRIAEDLHSHRAAVEHFNARLHKWGILDCRIFRQHPDRFQIFYRVCVQLTELKRRFPVHGKK